MGNIQWMGVLMWPCIEEKNPTKEEVETLKLHGQDSLGALLKHFQVPLEEACCNEFKLLILQ